MACLESSETQLGAPMWVLRKSLILTEGLKALFRPSSHVHENCSHISILWDPQRGLGQFLTSLAISYLPCNLLIFLSWSVDFKIPLTQKLLKNKARIEFNQQSRIIELWISVNLQKFTSRFWDSWLQCIWLGAQMSVPTVRILNAAALLAKVLQDYYENYVSKYM